MTAKTNHDFPIKCVDVSSYQGSINWSAVKAAGIEHAILKIIRKDLSPDTGFELNWQNCHLADITVSGVYNYSYAATVQKAQTDAARVLSVLDGRKAAVWLDIEDKCQQGLGALLKDIINAYGDIILSSGCPFGVYTGMSFYNTYLRPYASQIICDNWWIARYYKGYSRMTPSLKPNEQYNPKHSIGRNTIHAWQYTSSGQVPGIYSSVDLNLIYGDIIPSSPSFAENEGITGGSSLNAIGRVSGCCKLNMRKAPKVEAGNIIQVLNAADQVCLLHETGSWYLIKTLDNQMGYVSKKYITKL